MVKFNCFHTEYMTGDSNDFFQTTNASQLLSLFYFLEFQANIVCNPRMLVYYYYADVCAL